MISLSPLLSLVAIAVDAGALADLHRPSRTKLFPASLARAGRVVRRGPPRSSTRTSAASRVVRVRPGRAGGGADGGHEPGALRLPAADDPLHRQVQTPRSPPFPCCGLVGVLALGGWLAIRQDITLGTFPRLSTYLALAHWSRADAHQPRHQSGRRPRASVHPGSSRSSTPSR